MSILWIVLIGFVAGIIARLLAPGPNNPTGFILTTLLGIGGAFVATWIGQAVGWYHQGQNAGFLGAVVGSLLVLFVWHRLVVRYSTVLSRIASEAAGANRGFESAPAV